MSYTTTTTNTTHDPVVERVVTVRRRRGLSSKRAYRWPELMLSLLLFVLFVCAAITLGTFSYFTYVQKRLLVAVPWYYYFLISTSVLTIVFVSAVVGLYYVHLLLPIITIVCAFILFVFWLTGLIKASIELWGPLGSINDNCVRNVYRSSFWGGKTIDTIARIQQEGMCNLWKTTFAMEMVASFVLLWIILLSWSVMRGARGI